MVHILLSALLTLFTCNKAGRLEDMPHRRSKNKKPSSAVESLPILQYCRWNGQRLWWELPPCSCMVEIGHSVFTLLIYAAQYHCSCCREVGDTHTPSTQLVEKKAMFLVSSGFSWEKSGDLVWGSDSPVSEELSTYKKESTLSYASRQMLSRYFSHPSPPLQPPCTA